MKIQILKPKVALNKAFLKVKPNRTEIESFKKNLIQLLDSMNDSESEEHHKNLVIDFLKKTYYDQSHFVNTKGRNDLVIHNGDKATSTVGVIIEAKKPTNKGEMVKAFALGDTQEQMISKLNTKAFQELVLYYLRERITHNNIEIKHLIATNINEWFIFDVTTFDRLFAQNKSLVKQFNDFEGGRLADTKTDFFYKQVAEPFIAQITQEIEFTYFNIKDYEKPLRNNNPTDDNLLIALFKLLSPQHLLKQSFVNDSNSLDKRFYGELLHIIGLTETKEGSKKLIQRHNEGERNTGSLLENAIIQLDSLDKIQRLPTPSQFGADHQERLFNVGLELSITWINRILFLKLLEAQLINYQKGNKEYEFLSLAKIHDYDDLNSLFFQVLARKQSDRNADVKTLFAKVPYLNSSLFEPTDIEHNTLFISNLRDEKTIPIYSQSVLKDDNGKKRTGELSTIKYLFEFLNAYDFASEGSEEIQEDNKTLINASVLGLIFEKINGYKDGSFFTPGFITMYMCRETIRKAVVQKFNEAKGWDCADINTLYDKIDDRTEANTIINSLKICDPAVGSGHFLVSALNEIIAIKHELKVLQDRSGKRLKEYRFEVVNDELIVTDEEGEFFEYNPKTPESQRIQETLFHEKQTIIENCLFGVDINPNSVKICRLRLWIELLKNAYYKNETELETLPNIDINIKCGNSLVSRFPLDVDLKQALKKINKWNINDYRIAVSTYRNAKNKEQKHEMERLINEIRNSFESEIAHNDKRLLKLNKAKGELLALSNQTSLALFERTKVELSAWNKEVKILTDIISATEKELDEIRTNRIYENAFEWRFEFPEVLNDNGDFVGFDMVIGNPPYFQIQYSGYSNIDYFKSYKVFEKTGDIYSLFFEKSVDLLRSKGILSLITSNRFCNTNYGLSTRDYLSKLKLIELINFNNIDIFEEANVGTIIISVLKDYPLNNFFRTLQFNDLKEAQAINANLGNLKNNTNQVHFGKEQWVFGNNEILNLKHKIKNNSTPLSQVKDLKINRGITTGANNIFIISKEIGDSLISKDVRNAEIIKPVLKGAEIKRFEVKDFNNYILLTKTGVQIENYPDVLELLSKSKNELENVYEAKNGTKKWYELRKCSYYSSFEEEKLIWTRLSSINSFAISNQKEISIDSTSFATGRNLKFYCALLNSKVTYFYFKLGSVIWGTDGIKWFGEFFDSIPIRIIEENSMTPFCDLIDQIAVMKKNNTDTSSLEAQIDQLVYQLYELTPEEIDIIEKA